MKKIVFRLQRMLLAEAHRGNENIGALIIVGHADAHNPNQGVVTSFSGGNPAPIVMGLVKEMKRDSSILASVRMALSIVDNDLAQQN